MHPYQYLERVNEATVDWLSHYVVLTVVGYVGMLLCLWVTHRNERRTYTIMRDWTDSAREKIKRDEQHKQRKKI